MTLRCCRKKCQIIESIPLYDTNSKKHRVLVVGRCRNEKCNALKAEFIYYDIYQGRFLTQSIKKDKIKEIIDVCKNEPSVLEIENNLKNGSKYNQNWVYGQAKVKIINGQEITEFIAVDFNGVKKKIGQTEKCIK